MAYRVSEPVWPGYPEEREGNHQAAGALEKLDWNSLNRQIVFYRPFPDNSVVVSVQKAPDPSHPYSQKKRDRSGVRSMSKIHWQKFAKYSKRYAAAS